MLGVVAHSSTDDVSAKLKVSLKDKLTGAVCPAHILNNCLQHGMDALGIQSVVLKMYYYCRI
jgi:hypothetical protein